ncbi:MAG: hypothetical protein ACYDD1_22930, partial [Caulobacteraceae bacterium]
TALGAQLPAPVTEGPPASGLGQPPISLPGFSGSNIQPQVIDNPPPSQTPVDSTPAPTSPQ